MLGNQIARQTNYLNKDIIYLRNVVITEWDIKSAGFNVLKFKNVLSSATIQEWEKLDKHSRTIKEGLLQKENPNIAKLIIETLSKVREAFVVLNKIETENILSIKKDAIFLINKTPTHTIIKDVFEFRKKGEFTSYLYINKKEFYYNSRTDEIVVKGIDRENSEKCKEFINIIKILMKLSEKNNNESLYSLLKQYRKKYLQKKLPLECYRELDSGYFRVGDYLLEDVENLDDVDISQNYISYLLPVINSIL